MIITGLTANKQLEDDKKSKKLLLKEDSPYYLPNLLTNAERPSLQ